MKAILINATKREISEVTISGDYMDINKHIGCELFTIGHSLKGRDAVFVDDEGLFNNENTFFTFEGAHQPFAGNGLICGSDKDGETTDCKIDIDEVKSKVQFYDRNTLAMAMAFGKVKY